MAKSQREMFKVFDGELNSFRETAALYQRIYKIKKSQLSELYFDNGESFDKEVEVFNGLMDKG